METGFGEMRNVVEKKVTKMDAKQKIHEGRLNDHDKLINNMQKQMESMAKQMAELDKKYALGKSIADTLQELDDTQWNRKPDPSVLRVNSPKDWDKKVFLDALTPWFEDANIDLANVQLEGPERGQRFIVRLNHADLGQRVRLGVQASSLLRVSGKWRIFETTDHTRIYVEGGKNAKRAKEEQVAKRIVRQLPTNPETKGWIDKRSDSEIQVRVKTLDKQSGETLVKVTAPARDMPAILVWDNKLAKKLGLNPVETEVKALAAAPRDDESKIFEKATCL
jgi:hypothetical protein